MFRQRRREWAAGATLCFKKVNGRSSFMIVVSSLENARAAYERFKPGFVVSILDADEPDAPSFDGLRSENHIKLIGDCARPENCSNGAGRCNVLLRLAERWLAEPGGAKPSILIHCNEGAARSMAVAYILLCILEKGASERTIAQRLRAAAPHADPNLMLVSEADALLARNDRMVEAILDLKPACTSAAAPVVTLPVAA